VSATLQIYRSTTAVPPSSLVAGQLALSQGNNTLYCGRPSDGLVMPIAAPDPIMGLRVAATTNITTTYTSTAGPYGTGQHTACPKVIDGVTLVAGDRFGLFGQTTGSQNGGWVVTTLGTGANGVWDRIWDFSGTPFAIPGTSFKVGPEGTVTANKLYDCTNAIGFIIGTASGSSLAFQDHNAAVTSVGTITTGVWNATPIGSQYGGTGINTSGSTGVPSISAGTWSVNSTLPVTLGGTGAATLTGLVKGNGASAFTAAVAGTDYLGPTGGATVTTVGTIGTGVWNGTAIGAQYGGTGINTSAATGVAIVTAGTWSTPSQLGVPQGGTGVATLTGLVKGNGASAFTAAVSGTDYLPITGGASITTVGTIGTGVWNGTAVGSQYGGTGINTSASTGVPSISAGTWSVSAQLPVTLGGTGVGTLTGLVKGNGTSAFTAAVSGTDYLPITGGTSITTLGTVTTGTIDCGTY
jgi:hypothetical protein